MNRAQEILSALKKQEKDAFKIFFLEYYDVLVLFATGILKDVNEAEDIVQACFLNIWENHKYEHLTDGLDRYMFRSVKNAALNDLRGLQRRELRHEKAMAEYEFIKEIQKEEEPFNTEILYAAINQLPPERRRIFMLICAQGMKYQEVADQLKISINTVRTQMGRSVKFLREKLKNQSFSILLFFRLKLKNKI